MIDGVERRHLVERDALDRGLRADRHECRRLHHAVRQRHASAAGATAARSHVEAERGAHDG